MKKRTVVLREVVPSYVPKEGEIFRVTFDDGDVGYRNAGGSDIHVYETELDLMIVCWVDRLRDMVKTLDDDDDDHIEFRLNLDTLLRAFKREMNEVLSAVYATVGEIKCHLVGVNVAPWREARVVGIEFVPVEEGGAA